VTTVRSKQLWSKPIGSAGVHDMYTVPSGSVVILKSMVALHNVAAAGDIRVYIHTSTLSADVMFKRWQPTTFTDELNWAGWLVLKAGDIVRAYTSAAVNVDQLIGCGAELSA